MAARETIKGSSVPPAKNFSAPSSSASKKTINFSYSLSHALAGIFLGNFSCCSSFSSVYFEKHLKARSA
jgi:hypothetical protein